MVALEGPEEVTKRRGQLVPAPQWWMHLRPYWKRLFWKRERKAQKELTRALLQDPKS
jgi:hypothetical protein